jgi:multidrug efflux pump
VFAGMLGVTLFGIFLTPVFYYVIQWFGSGTPGTAPPLSETRPTTHPPPGGPPAGGFQTGPRH